MAVGTLGKNIIFEVSDSRALVFNNFKRNLAGRWAAHEALGSKPRAEFLGADTQKITLDVYLSAGLGLRPRQILEAVAAMVESGAAEYLIIGDKPVSNNPFRITAASEAWDIVYNRGELVQATLSLTLEEYV